MQLTAIVRGERITPALGLVAAATAATTIAAARTKSRFVAAAALAEAALLVTGAFAHWVEPAWLDVTYTELEWRGARSLRIALLTDLHAEPHDRRRIRRIVAKTNALRPDLVLFGGDFVEDLDADPHKLASLAPLRRLRARVGAFAVLGNHDAEQDGEDTIRHTIERAGIRVLDNEAVALPGGARLIGLGSFRAGESEPAHAFAGLADATPSVVLIHNWRSLELPGVRRFDLALAGHTHGGQACVPFTGICPYLEDDMKPFARGLYEWPSGGRLYVSRGLGTSGVRARIGARPEIACFDLRASRRSRST